MDIMPSVWVPAASLLNEQCIFLSQSESMTRNTTDTEYKSGGKEEEWCTEMVHFIPCSKCTWRSKAHWETLVKPDYLPARKLIKRERGNLVGLACSYLFQQIPCPAARVSAPLYRQGRSLLGRGEHAGQFKNSSTSPPKGPPSHPWVSLYLINTVLPLHQPLLTMTT